MRKPRKIVDGACYHITAQVNRKEFIMNPPRFKKLFITILKRAKGKYQFLIKNFCVMGNHVHIMLKPLKTESISRIMQWILATFAINYNKICNISGHVWYDRFHSKVIESFRQYLKTFEYISNNPVRAKLVENINDYRFCGRWYIRQRLYDLVDPPNPALLLMYPEMYENIHP